MPGNGLEGRPCRGCSARFYPRADEGLHAWRRRVSCSMECAHKMHGCPPPPEPRLPRPPQRKRCPTCGADVWKLPTESYQAFYEKRRCDKCPPRVKKAPPAPKIRMGPLGDVGRSLLAIVIEQSGSIRAAARLLGVDPSTVSRAVDGGLMREVTRSRLEHQLVIVNARYGQGEPSVTRALPCRGVADK